MFALKHIMAQNTSAKISIPITRRSKEPEQMFKLLTAIVDQAILLASVHRFSAPSQGFPQ